MTGPRSLALAGVAVLGLWLPGAVAAQSIYCIDVATSVCGDLPVNQCMVFEDIPYNIPEECVGDVQWLHQQAVAAEEQYYQDQQACDPAYDPNSPDCDPALVAGCDPGPAAGGGGGSVPAGFDAGYSFGGNLRNGPGDGYPVVGSLPEGTYVALSASGTWSGGYQWFYVDSDYGSAYHWGGLMCSMDYYIDGVLQVC